MLSIESKIEKFENYLLIKKNTYADKMKDEIYYYFFELNEKQQKENFSFLNAEKNEIDIEEKIEFVVSKMIMHEDDDGLHNIMLEYFFE